MMEPERVMTTQARTKTGALSSRDLALARERLLDGGLVVLPSDTCYSIAMIPEDSQTRGFINTVLDRPAKRPISLAFPGIPAAGHYVELTPVVVRLLEAFTPGPITVVARVRRDSKVFKFVDEAVGAMDRTIGVRIPDSITERDIASCVASPVTTVAVRDSQGAAVRSLDEAIDVVRKGLQLSPRVVNWIAIQGEEGDFRSRHSSVVRVDDGGNVTNIRDGDIPFNRIEQAAHSREMEPKDQN